MSASFDFDLLVTPIVVTCYLLCARALGGTAAGFLCGLPYASALMIYAIWTRFGDLGALNAIQSAICVKVVFLIAAIIYTHERSAMLQLGSNSAKTQTKPTVGVALGVGVFALAIGLTGKYFGATYAGMLAGLPLGSLCMFSTLRAKSGSIAASECAKGFIAGQSITMLFLFALYGLTTQIEFHNAFVFCMTGVITIVALRITTALAH
jgi:hypothetical protein